MPAQFKGDNPNFTPGKHCTRCRYTEIDSTVYQTTGRYQCKFCEERFLKGRKRSEAAKRAVKWPSRSTNYVKESI